MANLAEIVYNRNKNREFLILKKLKVKIKLEMRPSSNEVELKTSTGSILVKTIHILLHEVFGAKPWH